MRVINGGIFELDSINQCILKDGSEIQLTRKEFLVLECLMCHSGTLVSRSELFGYAWDMNADLFSNSLETHIVNLRKKLGVKKNEFIRTISGRGYRIG